LDECKVATKPNLKSNVNRKENMNYNGLFWFKYPNGKKIVYKSTKESKPKGSNEKSN